MTIPDPIQLTQDLIRFNTVNPPGNEDQLCDYLTQLLESAGFECMNVDFAPRRRSVVARIVGSSTNPNICFTGHVDVVPLEIASGIMIHLLAKLRTASYMGAALVI